MQKTLHFCWQKQEENIKTIIYFIQQEKDLRGEVAVITGGGHGIGLELVR